MTFPPSCPLHALTGLECPLCGGTRAMAALVAGDWVGALRFNPLVVIGVGLLAIRLLWMIRQRSAAPVIPATLIRWILIAAASFAIARNIAKMILS